MSKSRPGQFLVYPSDLVFEEDAAPFIYFTIRQVHCEQNLICRIRLNTHKFSSVCSVNTICQQGSRTLLLHTY
jgi:hypothetical protein